jgi:hypothetical protein
VKQNEIYSVIVAATPDGRLLASSTPLTAGSVRISDRKYFRDALRTKDFSAGEYVMGRVSGVPVINYGYPVLDENENIVTVVVAGFKLYKYDNFIIMEEVNGWRLENIQNVSSCIITLCRFLRQARHLPDFMPGESGSVKLRPLNGRMIFMIPSFFC